MLAWQLLRRYQNPMNRAVEIINSLRAGMQTLVNDGSEQRVNSLRMFNFEKNRVSLRMELIDHENVSRPMGMIDVIEYPTGEKNKSSCNCHMTELATGKTEKLVLKLNNQDQQKIECTKVLNFFRKVLSLPEVKELEPAGTDNSEPLSNLSQQSTEKTDLFPPADGKLPQQPRGAQ